MNPSPLTLIGGECRAASIWGSPRENRGDARVRSGRDRLSYQTGVIRGFGEKLAAERAMLRGTGLVWRGDAELQRFFRTRHPRTVSRRSRTRLDDAHAAGREAGGKVLRIEITVRIEERNVALEPDDGPALIRQGAIVTDRSRWSCRPNTTGRARRC